MALRRFSDNPAATLPLTGAETLPALQAGGDVQVTVQDVIDAASGAVTSVNGATGAVVIEADGVPFDNTASGLTATDVQAAIDEIAAGGGGGGGGVPPVVTESGTSLAADDTNSGNYTRFTNSSAKTYTFDDAESYVVGAEYHGRNVGVGDLTITEAGTMTINPPAGGTLVIPQGGTFTVKIVAADEADLFGVTVAAS